MFWEDLLSKQVQTLEYFPQTGNTDNGVVIQTSSITYIGYFGILAGMSSAEYFPNLISCSSDVFGPYLFSSKEYS